MKISRVLTWTKAGKTRTVNLSGTMEDINRLCRNLDADTGVDFYLLTRPSDPEPSLN